MLRRNYVARMVIPCVGSLMCCSVQGYVVSQGIRLSSRDLTAVHCFNTVVMYVASWL